MTTTRMTSAMRRSLERRLADLNDMIASLEVQLEGDFSVEASALLRHLTSERDQLWDALRDVRVIDDDPFDVDAIEIGDVFSIQDDDGHIDRYVLVDESVGSRPRSDWVSVSSPLGSAILGRSTGDQIEVESPRGPISYVVVAFERASDESVLIGRSGHGNHRPSDLPTETFLG